MWPCVCASSENCSGQHWRDHLCKLSNEPNHRPLTFGEARSQSAQVGPWAVPVVVPVHCALAPSMAPWACEALGFSGHVFSTWPTGSNLWCRFGRRISDGRGIDLDEHRWVLSAAPHDMRHERNTWYGYLIYRACTVCQCPKCERARRTRRRPSCVAAMPRLDDFSDLSDAEPEAATSASGSRLGVPVVASPGALRPVGSGRWGTSIERMALTARMREAKARKKAAAARASADDAWAWAASLNVPLRSGGNQWVMKSPVPLLLQVAFSPGRRSADLAAQFNVKVGTIGRVFTCVAALYMALQSAILGCIVMRCGLEPPTAAGYRLAWDETGQNLTTKHGNHRESSTVHILVARIKIFVAWGEEQYSFIVAFAH